LISTALGCARRDSIEVTASAGPAEADSKAGADTPGSEPAADRAGDSRGTIAFSALTLTNPFFVVIADNLKAEAERHGFEVIVDDADGDVRKQTEQINSYITRGVAAIVINPCDRISVGPAIEQANAAGIPVFTCDLQCVATGAEIAGHVGTDNFQGGQLAGKALIEALGDSGGKILILHYKQANSCVLRVDGFREVIDAYNAGRESGKIEVVAELEGGGLRDPAFNATAAAVQSHPDLAGIFAINDPSALGAYAALEQAGKAEQIRIVAFDGQRDGKQAIKEGKIYADPIQFPDKMGRLTMQKIQKYLAGEPFEKTTLIPTELYRQEDALQDPVLQ
jgi:ribose transport system substrate-binding protein